MFEAMEAPDILWADGHEYSLWDIQTFFGHRKILPDRQSTAIDFCLYQNMKEKDAAERMGIKRSNPVSTYATIGLTSLLSRAISGDLVGYYYELPSQPRMEMTDV